MISSEFIGMETAAVEQEASHPSLSKTWCHEPRQQPLSLYYYYGYRHAFLISLDSMLFGKVLNQSCVPPFCKGVGLEHGLWTPYVHARACNMSGIESRLRERDEARKAAVAARRLEREKESRVEETSEYFSEQFSSLVKGKSWL